MQTEMLEPESLVRGLGFASPPGARGRALPLPRGAKMTDVPCHSWILPTLLDARRGELPPPGLQSRPAARRKVPELFWWEGPDGSRLLTMYSAAGYGSGLLPPAGWPHKTWLAMMMTSDNHGPPSPGEVKEVLDRVAEKLPGVKVRIGQLSDFSDRLLAEKPELPVVRGDMPDTWIHGPMCDPAGVIVSRRVAADIPAAESLATLLATWKVSHARPVGRDRRRLRGRSALLRAHVGRVAGLGYEVHRPRQDRNRRGRGLGLRRQMESRPGGRPLQAA